MRSLLIIGSALFLCLSFGSAKVSVGSNNLISVTGLKKNGHRPNNHAFEAIAKFKKGSVPTVVNSNTVDQELISQPILNANVSASEVRNAAKNILALYESHPQAISLLDALQLDEIGHSSLVKAVHQIAAAASGKTDLLNSLSYCLNHASDTAIHSELSSLEQSHETTLQAIQRALSAFPTSMSRTECLRSLDNILYDNPHVMTQLVILDGVVDPSFTKTILALEHFEKLDSSLISLVRSLIIAEESDVELQSALSDFERHRKTESTIASELFEMFYSPDSDVYLDRQEICEHSSTYQEAMRVASLASSWPSLVCELSSIESLEAKYSSLQRYVQSIMSVEGTSALTSVENLENQDVFQTCSCAESIESQLASFVELEIAYPYLAQDIVKIHKVKEAHSGFSAALSYISSFAACHAKELSEIYFNKAHPSITSCQSQLAGLQVSESTLLQMLAYVDSIEASNSGLSTALSVVRVVKLADPTVVNMVEYIVHEQSSEMSAAKYIGTLLSSYPMLLTDFDEVASCEIRYPGLATYEEIISTAYATEPTNVQELKYAACSPSKVPKSASFTSMTLSDSSLWKAIQFVEAILRSNSVFSKASKSLRSLTEQHPSAVQQIIFEEEMDPSLVSAEKSIASEKIRHPSISHDMDYIADLELLNSGLRTALQFLSEAESTSPTVLEQLVKALNSVSSSDKICASLDSQRQNLFHNLEIVNNVLKKHPHVVSAHNAIAKVQYSNSKFSSEFKRARSLTQSSSVSNLASIEEVKSSHPSFISDAEFLLHIAARCDNFMSAFNMLETAQASSPSTVSYFFEAARNRSATPTSYFEELVKSYPSLWTNVEYLYQLGNVNSCFDHDLQEVLSIIKSHPYIINDLLSIEAGTNPSVTAAEKLGVEEEQSLCQTTAVPRVQEVEEEIVEPKPKFVSTLTSYTKSQ